MGGNRSSRPGKRGEQGSSLIYVILSITLLSVFSCGYMAISRYQMKSVLTERTYMEAQITAKTIHSTFCEAVSSGNSQAINSIWQCFEEDCRMVREEYDEMMDSQEDGGGEGDIPDEAMEGDTQVYGDGEEDGSAYGEDGHAGDPEPEDRWERYLYHALGDKEYVMKGSRSLADGSLEVEISLAAKPLDEKASVHTEVVCNGYAFSLGADIVFDNSDGAVMTIGRDISSRSRRSNGNVEIYLSGNGVYRYYED